MTDMGQSRFLLPGIWDPSDLLTSVENQVWAACLPCCPQAAAGTQKLVSVCFFRLCPSEPTLRLVQFVS